MSMIPRSCTRISGEKIASAVRRASAVSSKNTRPCRNRVSSCASAACAPGRGPDGGEERGGGPFAVPQGGPEIAEQREPLLRRKLGDALIEEIALGGGRESESVEAAAAAVRKEPLRALEPHRLARM